MIRVPSEPVGRLGGAWRACVGTGRLELALRRDYQESLALLQREIGFRHIRGHGLLSDGMGVHRPYEWQGARQVRHAFTYVDQVVDAYLELGIRPFVELGFMPEELASGKQTVFWWGGHVTPPSSYQEWGDLVRATVAHLVDRYGLEEVRTWPIEVWNEPDLSIFWQDADQEAYHRLYEASALAVTDVDASLQVGGPALSPGADDGWLTRFAAFVEDRGLPVDFVSRHAYTSGPAQEVPFGTHQTLAPAGRLLEQFAAPRHELKGTGLAGLPVHITEFNSSYRPDNPVHDTAFHAAYLAPVVAGGGELVDSFSYWTFSDVFEEVGIPTALFHGGFGLLTHRQVKKPTYHLYAFMARMGDEVLARGDDHLVTRHPDGRISVLAWAAAGAGGHTVRLSLPVPDGDEVFVRRTSVDEERGNAYTAWRRMGSPQSPGLRLLDMLREAAEPVRSHHRLPVRDAEAVVEIALELNEVTLVEVEPVVEEAPPWWDERRLLGGGAERSPGDGNSR
ncbi:xylan 1,4-beta-xylosidase [Streptomyces sp. TRM66268-LWL]|uniref:Xylan 1,4-beta-xylosidase n=1 Tax=Streptomyces polyasparticus TaxID=2767826 RepID=A0ABR7SDV7_9ACTN|nr:xylan 1,4-beta-xylosidase [Streptomyces polyasparticus]MBC9712782.1 xylan 1,4-beta-xylosidase [Streptomyces polyasparticus]